MSVQFLQLAEPFWYYSQESQTETCVERVVGIGISSLVTCFPSTVYSRQLYVLAVDN